MRLSWSWWRWKYLFLVFFMIAWDSFLIFWYAMAMHGVAKGGQGPMIWIMVVFPIAHVAVGVGLSYSVVAQIFNRTTIDIDAESVRVRIGPVPWRGACALARSDILRLKIVLTSGTNQMQVYAIHAETRTEGVPMVIRCGDEGEAARYLARLLASELQVPLAAP